MYQQTAIGIMVPVTDTTDVRWLAGYYRARDWLIANSGRHARQASDDDEERAVSRWTNKQRRAYRGTTHHTMTAERIELIEALPGWSWDPQAESWMRHYGELVDWLRDHTQYPRDGGVDETEYLLAAWVSGQRQGAFGTGTRVMTESRGRLLEALPEWSWRAGYMGKPFSDSPVSAD